MGNKAGLAAVILGGLMYVGPSTDCGRSTLYSSPLGYGLGRYNLVENAGLAVIFAGLAGLAVNAFKDLGRRKEDE